MRTFLKDALTRDHGTVPHRSCFYLTSLEYSIVKDFVGVLLETMTLTGHFEINWTLVHGFFPYSVRFKWLIHCITLNYCTYTNHIGVSPRALYCVVDPSYGLGRSLGDCRPGLLKGRKYQMVKTQTESHVRRPIVWTNPCTVVASNTRMAPLILSWPRDLFDMSIYLVTWKIKKINIYYSIYWGSEVRSSSK